MTVNPYPSKSPETGPSSNEGNDGEEFNELLQGMINLADAEGGVSAVDFVERTIQEMEKMKIALDDFRMGLIVNEGFGSRESVFARVTDMTTEEFSAAYPGTIGEVIIWYIKPLVSE